MKDLIKPVLKALPAHRKFMTFLLLLFFFQTKAQTPCNEKAYEIINSIFGSGDTKIYDSTLLNKGWAHYFESYHEIFQNVGIPTLISDEEFKEVVTEDILAKINTSIYALVPCKLSSEYLENNITLSKEFDTEQAISQGIFRISMPIIIDDNIAVLKKESASESAIFILQKKNGGWSIIYTFYDWYKLED